MFSNQIMNNTTVIEVKKYLQRMFINHVNPSKIVSYKIILKQGRIQDIHESKYILNVSKVHDLIINILRRDFVSSTDIMFAVKNEIFKSV